MENLYGIGKGNECTVTKTCSSVTLSTENPIATWDETRTSTVRG
jgi:hypothetical protein